MIRIENWLLLDHITTLRKYMQFSRNLYTLFLSTMMLSLLEGSVKANEKYRDIGRKEQKEERMNEWFEK